MTVSIAAVVPVYNGERYIKEALDSVLAQTRPLDEIVVVDDGSTDGTPGLLAAYGAKVRVVRTENGGVAAARNRGLAEISTDVAAFLDADDRWRPEKNEAAAAAFAAHPEAALVFSDTVTIEADGRRGRRVRRRPEGADLFAALFRSNLVATSAAAVRRSAARDAGGFWEKFRCPAGAEDWDFFLRLSRSRAAVYLGRALVEYRRHAASAVQTKRFDLREDALDVVRRNADGVPSAAVQAALADVYYQSALRHLTAGDAAEARRDLSRSLEKRFSPAAAALRAAALGGAGFTGALIAARRALHRFRAGDPGDAPDVFIPARS